MNQFLKSFGSTAGAGAIVIFVGIFTVMVLITSCGGDDISKDDVATIIAANKDQTATPNPLGTAGKVDVSDPRLVALVDQAKTGKIKTTEQYQAAAKALGFNDQQITTVSLFVGPYLTAPAAATAGSTPSVVKTIGSMPTFVITANHGAWNIQGTDRLKDNPIVAGWLNRLKDPDPAKWRVFPNVPNPDIPEFRVVNGKQVPDGIEYGTYSSPFCFAHPCDIPVGAWEYRYISGDYQFLGTSCKGDKSKGCMLVLINVMDQSYTWRNQDVDNGFTLRGRYFNGDALEWGVWGLVSHGAANMLNMETFAHPGEILNAGAPGNSGANCGTPLGCSSVDTAVIVHGGDTIFAVARTIITQTGSMPPPSIK